MRYKYTGIFIVLLILFSFAAYIRNIAWKHDAALWEDAARKSPFKKRVHDNLGFAYYNQGRFKEAIKQYLPVLRGEPL
ncbi:MAG: hypothetical protein HZB79_04415 [Deltaproteobacteria bacterium]|nr:hypothetical protein [Deltaproteobacteria bacterium]